MRCVVCGSHVEKVPGNRLRCDSEGCGALLCPKIYGVECWVAHNKKVHPEKDPYNVPEGGAR